MRKKYQRSIRELKIQKGELVYLFFCLSLSVDTGDVIVDLVKEVEMEKGRMVYKTPMKVTMPIL